MILPPPIKQGDTIAVIAPAGMVNRRKVDEAIQIIRDRGFNVLTGEHLFDRHNRFAGKDVDRLSDLLDAVRNPEVKGIICARGGYGSVRILDDLDPKVFRENPKWITGYSDITFLHAWLQHHGMASIHGSLPVNFPTNTLAALDSLFQLMEGSPIDITSEAHELQKEGRARGRLLGGNLSILQSMQGMPEQFEFSGNILLIEEVSEYPYRVDRMMWNLKRSGSLDNLAGLVVGGFTSMQENDPPFGQSCEEIIYDLTCEYDYPVAMGLPIGHIDDNRAVILGGQYELTVDRGGGKVFLRYV